MELKSFSVWILPVQVIANNTMGSQKNEVLVYKLKNIKYIVVIW